MRPIYVYEVEIRLVNPNTKAVSLVTRTEHAYSVTDAVMQACVNQAGQAGSADMTVVRVGPPAKAVQEAAVELAEAVVGEMRRVFAAKGNR